MPKKIRILIAGFGSGKGNFENNISEEVVNEAAAKLKDKYGPDVEIITRVFPIDGANPSEMMRLALKNYSPPLDFVIGLGVLDSQKTDNPQMQFETQAVNRWKNGSISETLNPKNQETTLAGSDVSKLMPTQPVQQWDNYNNRMGQVKLRTSNDGGEFMCNAFMFSALETTDATFIHLTKPKDESISLTRSYFIGGYLSVLDKTLIRVIEQEREQQKLQAVVPKEVVERLAKGMTDGTGTLVANGHNIIRRG